LVQRECNDRGLLGSIEGCPEYCRVFCHASTLPKMVPFKPWAID
jgi:hypothetical protein